MRCRACDGALTDAEACAKNAATGEYEDMCSPCLGIVHSVLSGDSLEPQELDVNDLLYPDEEIHYEKVTEHD